MENILTNSLINLFVSIVIPVFNDSKGLKKCLDALENQTYPKRLYEVIVVDNASDEDIEGVVNQFAQAFTIRESYPSSYAARNKGISLAKGEIIAFTDADCIPASDWIDKGVANLLRVPNCGLVAGKVKWLFKNSNQPTAVELYESIHFIQKKSVEEANFGMTANVFTFKSVIDDVGGFDSTLKSGGDKDWGQRVFANGYQQIYADDTCVAHPARSSYGQIYKKSTRLTGGVYDLQKKNGYSYILLFLDLIKGLKPPLKTIFRILLGQKIYPWTEQIIKGKRQKFILIFVFLFVLGVSNFEKTRLLLGGKSKRG